MTDSAADRVARFVDDLLHGRRPRRFAASKEEAEAMTAAAGLVNDGGNISAVSGICTHLGCKLQPDDANRKLNCPCHLTAFSWSGKVLYYKLKSEPSTLPQIPVRVSEGQIELFVV